MTAAEFGEWFAIWKWQPWDPIPGPQQESESREIDPFEWTEMERCRSG